MRRISALLVALCVAGTLVLAAPAKAYYPDPGRLALRHVNNFIVIVFVLAYSSTPQRGMSPTEDCATGAPVEIERKTKSGWKVITDGTTNSKGKFKEKVKAKKVKKGKYRAHVLAYTTPDNNECFEGYGKAKKYKG